MCILVTLETFEHVVASSKTFCGSRHGRIVGASPAAADEQQQRLRVDLLTQLGQKMRVRNTSGIGVPLDLDGRRNAPDPIKLGTCPHVNNACSRSQPEHGMRFLRRQCATIRQTGFLCPLAGKLQDIAQGLHVSQMKKCDDGKLKYRAVPRPNRRKHKIVHRAPGNAPKQCKRKPPDMKGLWHNPPTL